MNSLLLTFPAKMYTKRILYTFFLQFQAFFRHRGSIWIMLLFSIFSSAYAQTTLEKIKTSGVINIGVRNEAFPFSYRDTNNLPIGYTVDICLGITQAIKQKIKLPDLKVEFVPVTPVSRIDAIVSGEIDLECGVTTNTAARRKQVDFAITTFIAHVRMLVHKNSHITSVIDLAEKRVIVTKGTTSESILNDLNKRLILNAKPVYTNSNQDSFVLFESGGADAFILDDIQLYGQRAISKNPEDLIITSTPLSLEPLAIAFRKDDPEFKKLVNDEVFKIITSGEISSIYAKWFESPIPPKQISLDYPMVPLLRDSFKMPTAWAP